MSRRLPARILAAIALALVVRWAFGALRGVIGDDLITVVIMLVVGLAMVSVGHGVLRSGSAGVPRPAPAWR